MKIRRQKINAASGYVLPNFFNEGDVVFVANIPKDAIVVGVKVGDKYLEDIAASAPVYPRTECDDGFRIVAKLSGMHNTQLHEHAISGIPTFEVEYYEAFFSEIE